MNKQLRVLVVEDEVIIRKLIVSQVEKCNAVVVKETGNGEEAVDFIAGNRDVDFVCMDINLNSSLDGIKAAEMINRYRSIPVLFISANKESQQINNGINFAGYLQKPFSTDDLCNVLTTHISCSQASADYM